MVVLRGASFLRWLVACLPVLEELAGAGLVMFSVVAAFITGFVGAGVEVFSGVASVGASLLFSVVTGVASAMGWVGVMGEDEGSGSLKVAGVASEVGWDGVIGEDEGSDWVVGVGSGLVEVARAMTSSETMMVGRSLSLRTFGKTLAKSLLSSPAKVLARAAQAWTLQVAVMRSAFGCAIVSWGVGFEPAAAETVAAYEF